MTETLTALAERDRWLRIGSASDRVLPAGNDLPQMKERASD
jgi:hypothetical protein